MSQARRVQLATAVVFLVLVAADRAFAQDSTRVIVQFRDDAQLATYAREYADDDRTAPQGSSTYHRRDIVGAAMSLERRHGFRATNFYSYALKGFAARVTAAQRRALEANPLVAVVEPDTPISLGPVALEPAQIVPWGIPKIGGDVNSTRAGNGSGAVGGVVLYIVDSGLDLHHPDLNVVGHMSFIGEPNEDCYGHGTAVAGIAAAADNSSYSVGVAPGAPVFGVKVFNCEGNTFGSVIIQAIDWLIANGSKPGVINLSIGSSLPLITLNLAVRNAAASGFVVSVAAGNEYGNACLSSPAGGGFLFGFPNGVVTTAATDIDDHEADFSNYGPCVDLWAPGVDLTSTWLLSDGGMITASGTSFSAPYVAGAAALLLSQWPTLPPWFVELILQLTAETPGTLSKDGRQIRRLSVRVF
jgi:subtilisin family serine protease